jgi:hypothetical protein
MNPSVWLASAGAAHPFAAPAQAARIPTADESAALTGLIGGVIATCDLQHAIGAPLVSDDGTWGRVDGVCGDPFKGGPELDYLRVWAHRTSATATDWAIAGPTEPGGLCGGKDGLLTRVPEAVVRDLRGTCSSGIFRRPAPSLMLAVFPTANDDTINPFVLLTRGRRGSPGAGILDYSPTLTLRELVGEFGKPRRTRCGARWPDLKLTATVCASGHVAKLTLGASWRLSFADEDAAALVNPVVRVGDTVELARYLDPVLTKLGPTGRFRLAKLRITKVDVTIAAVTRAGRVTAFEVAIRQRR